MFQVFPSPSQTVLECQSGNVLVEHRMSDVYRTHPLILLGSREEAHPRAHKPVPTFPGGSRILAIWGDLLHLDMGVMTGGREVADSDRAISCPHSVTTWCQQGWWCSSSWVSNSRHMWPQGICLPSYCYCCYMAGPSPHSCTQPPSCSLCPAQPMWS